MTSDNRVARNQAPPLAGHNTVTSDAALVEAVTRHASADAVADLTALGDEAGSAEAREHGMLANEFHPELMPFDRYGNRIDEVRFHPSWHWLMERAVGHRSAGGTVGVRRPARPRTPRRRLLRLADRARPRLPDLDDVRRDPGPARRRRDRQGVDAQAGFPLLRPRPAPARREDRCPRRDGDDREAGRFRRPGQRDAGLADLGRRRVHPRRPQVVHLGPDERRVPRAGAGAGRAELLPGPAGASFRRAQPARRRTAQGQAGQPLQRLLGAGVPRHLGAAARRRGSRRPHDHRDGRRHPARLRPRLGLTDAQRARRGLVARRAPFGLRRPARRQAADAERHRRPRRRVRGRHRRGHPARGRRRQPHRPTRGGVAPDRPPAREVLGLQAHADDGRRGARVPRRQRLSSRSPACRCCSASHR